MNRRNFLKIAGGGVILAAGSAGLFAATRTPTKALAPWGSAGGAAYADPRMHALSYAILAPNPHNQQPWLIKLEGDNRVSLFFNDEQDLPHTDPFDRQLTIGLGCFLELMTMAANAHGYAVDLELFPEGFSDEGLDERPVAHATFRPDASVSADPLWAQVPHRRSNKEPFDVSRKVPEQALADVLAAPRATMAGGSIDEGDISFWRQFTSDALMIEIETPRTYKESVDVFRIGKAEVNASPDGIDFSGAMFDSMRVTGLFTRDVILDTTSVAYQQGIAAVLANTETAMGHVWLVSEGNTRLDQIATGSDWLRLNLATTAAGLGYQPLSQALQEYPEMESLYAEVHERLAPNGGTVQMLGRIGYGVDVPVSPRWPIEAKVVSA